ncbi:MAG: DNA polymerase Y family protein, partial [Miltoncostaeaceae bacterium]
MVVATVIPRFPLLVAALRARRPLDVPVALGPAPGDPQVVGLSSPPAREQGVVPGLRVGEALARCPSLELINPDPAAVAEAAERLVVRIEDLGARVEHVAPG